MRRGVMMLFLCFGFLLRAQGDPGSTGPALKAVIYDFDGLDVGCTDLPDGDYGTFDLNYKVEPNPLQASEVLGDRVLELDLNWHNGTGQFAKELARYMELDPSSDRLSFYFYNPASNGEQAQIELIITEDDNNDSFFEEAYDDKWVHDMTVPCAPGWQLFSIPLSAFYDANAGGNGIFDANYSGPGGMLFSVGFNFIGANATHPTAQYFIDMICFTEGTLPTGADILDLPSPDPSYSCDLGALTNQASPDQTPAEVMSYLPPTNRIKYVNWFLDYTRNGTNPDQFPGPEVQHLIDAGYRPVITWEMMYGGYSRLDPVQPRLDKIVNGYFDAYLDAFADRIRSYSDTVVMRIFHEFEGNWYCWSLAENNRDPQLYISAFRHVVDRFRARGAGNVKWMWCVNAEPKPYSAYNWIISAYPGDNYVDIVAADIYNHPNTGVPPWKSFRYTLSENYFYLTHYFPNKPFYICEVACRERYGNEPVSSQTKGEWLCAMTHDLKAYFGRTRALIFFSEVKEHDWRINSSNAALEAFKECIWQDSYFGDPLEVSETKGYNGFNVYPNPFTSELHIAVDLSEKRDLVLNVYDITGKKLLSVHGNELQDEMVLGQDLASGVYVVELRNDTFCRRSRVVKSKS